MISVAVERKRQSEREELTVDAAKGGKEAAGRFVVGCVMMKRMKMLLLLLLTSKR